MNTKKKYLATIFIIFIISLFTFAMVSTTSIAKTEFAKENVKFSFTLPEGWGNGYIAGDTIKPTIEAEIDVTDIDPETELYFKSAWGDVDYSSYVYIIYRGDKTIELDQTEKSDYKNVESFTATPSGDSNIIKVSFEWNLNASTFIELGGMTGKEPSSLRKLNISLNSPKGQLESHGGYMLFLSDKPIEAPTIDCDTEKWYKNAINVTLRSSSTTIPAKKFEYTLSGATVKEKQTVEAVSATINISEDGITHISAKYTDAKERVSPSGEYYIKIDKTAPTIKITDNKNTNNFIESVKVDVEENGSGIDKYNGLKYFWTTEDMGNADDIPTNKFNRSFTNNSNIPFETTSGTYYLYIMAKDNAGNVTKQKSNSTYIVDLEKPTVTFTPNGNKAYENAPVIKVTIKDTLSGIDKETVKYLWKTQKQTPKADDFKDKIASEQLGEKPDEVEFTVPLLETMNTKYYLYIYAKDKMGNEIIITSNEFLIDNEKPVITLAPESNETYRRAYSVRITATDKNGIDEDSLKYFWSKEDEEKLFSSASSYKSSYAISTENLKEDGQYYLYVQAGDKAGNKEFKKSGLFYLDVTSPVITINPENNNDRLTEKDLKVSVEINDSSSLMLKKYKWQKEDITPNVSNMDNLTNESLSLPEEDGEYYLYIYALDSLGNSSWKRAGKFVVDKTAPSVPKIVAKQDGSDAEVSNDSLISPKIELEIIPGNDNRNDAKVTLEFDIKKDSSSIKESAQKSGDKYILEDDGKYTITAKCKDDAGNTSTEATLTFTIDKNVPRVPTIKLSEEDTGNVVNNNSEINKNVKVEVTDQDDETTEITIYKDEVIQPTKTEEDYIVLNESGSYRIVFLTYKKTDDTKDKAIHSEMHIIIDKEYPVATGTDEHTIRQDESHSDSLEATDNNTIAEYIITKDPDNGTLTSFNKDYGTFTYKPNSGYYGTDTFKFKVRDKAGNESNEATITIKIRKNLVASDIVSNTTISIKENETYTSSSFILKDLNGLDLTYSVFNNAVNGKVEFDSVTGKYTYTPNEGYSGTDKFTIRVTNGIDTIDILFTIEVKANSSSHGGGGGRRWWRWKHHN